MINILNTAHHSGGSYGQGGLGIPAYSAMGRVATGAWNHNDSDLTELLTWELITPSYLSIFGGNANGAT